MAEKKKHKTHSFIKAILNLLVVIPTILNVASKISTLLSYEGRLAGKSLVRILILTFFCAMLLTSTWICILIMLFHWFVEYVSFQIALLFLILINLFLLTIIGIVIAKSGKNLTFPLTRKLFLPHKKISEDY